MAAATSFVDAEDSSTLGGPTPVIDRIAQNFITNDELPYVTSASLPGIGGRLKAKLHHFVVTEIPLFQCNNKIDK